MIGRRVDGGYHLAQPPWHVSNQRLVRNDPATLWHAGLSHGFFEPVFPSVHLSEGFYHLSLLVNDVAYREAKVAHYLSIASGHSRRVLEVDVAAFYVPERDRRPESLRRSSPVPAMRHPHELYGHVWHEHFARIARDIAQPGDRLLAVASDLGTRKRRGAFHVAVDEAVRACSPPPARASRRSCCATESWAGPRSTRCGREELRSARSSSAGS